MAGVKYNQNYYSFKGKKLTLNEIIDVLHPKATSAEIPKYYQRYYQRMSRGLSFEEAIAAGTGPLQKRPHLATRIGASVATPKEIAKPDVIETTAKIETIEAEEVEEQSEYERALAYARTVQVTFRKYQGLSLAHVLETEPSYIEWMRRKLVDNADDTGLKVLYSINKLYNDYPVVQDYIEKATEDYFTKLNASNSVPATISLADNLKLQSLLVVDTAPREPATLASEEPAPLDLNDYSFQELEEMQALLAEEKEALRHEQSEMDKRRPVIIKRLGTLHLEAMQIETKLDELRPKAPAVSDHALVRYLERVMGMDVEKLREQVVGGENRNWLFDYQSYGAGRYVVGDSHRVHIENNTVVTVIPR